MNYSDTGTLAKLIAGETDSYCYSTGKTQLHDSLLLLHPPFRQIHNKFCAASLVVN